MGRWTYTVTPCNPPEVFYYGPEIDRETAFSLGRTRYFTGEPCIHGHVAERWVANRACSECIRQQQRSAGHHERMAHRRVTDTEFAASEKRRYAAGYESLRQNDEWMAKRAARARQWRAARKAAGSA